jgi:hypothetical protein
LVLDFRLCWINKLFLWQGSLSCASLPLLVSPLIVVVAASVALRSAHSGYMANAVAVKAFNSACVSATLPLRSAAAIAASAACVSASAALAPLLRHNVLHFLSHRLLHLLCN